MGKCILMSLTTKDLRTRVFRDDSRPKREPRGLVYTGGKSERPVTFSKMRVKRHPCRIHRTKSRVTIGSRKVGDFTTLLFYNNVVRF